MSYDFLTPQNTGKHDQKYVKKEMSCERDEISD